MGNELSKLKWVVVDGLPFYMLNKYVKPDVMPCLNNIIKLNNATALEPLYPNCQTPPSLFSIWSGHSAMSHQIFGYDTPKFEQTGGFYNGFSSWPAHIDMVWDIYAKAGQNVRLNHVPFVHESKLGKHLVARSNIYEDLLYSSSVTVLEQSLEIPNINITITFEPLSNTQTKLHIIGQGRAQFEVIENEHFVDITVNSANQEAVTLMISATDQGTICCLLGRNHYQRSGINEDATGTPAGSSFHHSSLASQYRKGLLGTKISHGGSGRAELLFFKSLEKIHVSFCQELVTSFSRLDAELYVGYYPVIDLALHEIIGLDSLSSNNLVLTLFEQLLIWLEELIAGLQLHLKDDERLIVNSDHGMQKIETTCFLNQYLADQELLFFDNQGMIDWTRTKVAYHPAENGSLVIKNTENSVFATRAEQVILQFFNQHDLSGAKIELIELGPTQKDFDSRYFLFPPDGVRVKATCSHHYIASSEKSGDHCGYSQNESLQGVLLSQNNNKKQSKSELYEILKFASEK